MTPSLLVRLSFFSFLLLISAEATSQHICGFDLMNEQVDDSWIDEALEHGSSHYPEAEVTLPVVFHIIKNGTQGDVLDADILAGFANLNAAFANTGYYDPSTGADTEIRFCLAKQDENGLPTTGITRTESPLTTMTVEEEDAQLKALIHWDATCYINIYVIFDIVSSSVGTGVQGYSNFPNSHGSPTDGLVVESAFMSSDPIGAVVLAHEMGHFLGLFHTFRGGCTNNDCLNDGDRVCDTPPDNSTAPSPCENPINSCNTDAQSGLPSDVPDMVTNYMDYGYNSCRNDFTQGQADRMQMAIMDVRFSLMNCPSCEDPCPNPFAVSIDFDSLDVAIANPYELEANGNPTGSTIEWLVDGINQGSGNIFNTSFNDEGKVVIILKVTGQDPKCVAYDTICVDVYCPVELTVLARDTSCLVPGSTLQFSASATGATGNIEWYINGALDQSGNNFSWVVPAVGVFELEVKVSNGDCSDRSKIYFLFVNCKEICDNGIDDDGDGLVDGYDPDCCDTINQFFFDPCYDQCPYEIKDAFTSIQRKYKSTGYHWHDANTALIGDVDNDGEIEIVGYEADFIIHPTNKQQISGDFLIVNAEDGQLEVDFDPGFTGAYSKNISMADTDGNGYVEIYSNSRNLRRHDLMPNGTMTLRWTAAGGGFSQPTITDIDEDGLPEILLDNGIYAANNGQQLINISGLINEGSINYIAGNGGSAAVDVLPTNFCPNCQGKELILGNQVFSVSLDRTGFSRLNLEVEYAAGQDGYTSIADFDLDGDLDAIVVYTVPLPNFESERHLYVWDIQTPNALTTEIVWDNPRDRVAHPAVGDVTGDGKPEIAVTDYGTIRCVGYENGSWVTYFNLRTNDNSGMAGCAMFDFDADGRMEVYHRDQTDLRILEGQTGRILWSTPCTSGTGYEVPTVADVDLDREAELVCSCDSSLHVFEPNPGTWALTRPVWNQLLYYVVNINDDLTVPGQQQQHHLPGMFDELNMYIGQYATKEYQASDLTMSVIDKFCEGNNVRYVLNLCNLGPATFNDTLKLTGYQQDPRTSISGVDYRQDTLIPILYRDSCMEIEIVIPRVTDILWLVANDDGTLALPFDLERDFPSTNIDECDFLNNIIALSGFPLLMPPDLGLDTSICDFGTMVLDAGDEYSEYRWEDGTMETTHTIFSPGKYWVEVIDSCGKVYSDTIEITVNPATRIDLGMDIDICVGDTVNLSTGAIGDIIWTPSDVVNCPTCPDVRFSPDSSVVIAVTGKTEDGCFGFDSIRINVGAGYIARDSIRICPDDSIMVGGDWFRSGQTYADTIDGPTECDSINNTFVFAVPLDVDLGMDYQVCSGETVEFDLTSYDSVAWDAATGFTCLDCPNQSIDIQTTRTFRVEVFDDFGCMNSDELTVTVTDTVETMDTMILCQGDSTLIFGDWVSAAGTYTMLMSSTEGCDTLAVVEVGLDPIFLAPIQDLQLCQGDTLDFILGASDYQTITWSGPGGRSCNDCPDIRLYPDNTTSYKVKITSENGCEIEDSFLVSVMPELVLEDTVRLCLGRDSFFFNNEWIKVAGDYEGRRDHSGCDTLLRLHVNTDEINVFLPDTIVVEPGSLVPLQPGGDVATSYRWSSALPLDCDTCEVITATAISEGEVFLTVTSANGCEKIIKVVIIFKEKVGVIYIPNIFSPNGDNLNDKIEIFTNDEDAFVKEVSIYDRWGELVYQAKDIPVKDWKGWDGTFNGELMNPAVFVIFASGTYGDGQSFKMSSDITLVR